MQVGWQDIVSLLIVAVAFGYVVTRIYVRLARRENAGCGGGCFGCAQPTNDSADVVVTIGTSESLRPSSHK